MRSKSTIKKMFLKKKFTLARLSSLSLMRYLFLRSRSGNVSQFAFLRVLALPLSLVQGRYIDLFFGCLTLIWIQIKVLFTFSLSFNSSTDQSFKKILFPIFSHFTLLFFYLSLQTCFYTNVSHFQGMWSWLTFKAMKQSHWSSKQNSNLCLLLNSISCGSCECTSFTLGQKILKGLLLSQTFKPYNLSNLIIYKALIRRKLYKKISL